MLRDDRVTWGGRQKELSRSGGISVPSNRSMKQREQRRTCASDWEIMRRPRNKGQLGHAESLKRNTMMEHVHITSEDRVKRIAKDACSMMDERTSGLDKLNKTLIWF